ncbi:MAG: hypothetical protein ACRDSJ_24805 [Rubrobacteraceae bacterium]
MEGELSEPRPILCPLCEVDEMSIVGPNMARCHSCEYAMGGELIGTLRGMARLPDAFGRHACECGYPEMRLLPDGVYHCPSCGSEVTPADAPTVEWKTGEHSEAYWRGWLDGKYAQVEDFVHSPRLAKWESAADRLEYYRGHRAGSSERRIRE